MFESVSPWPLNVSGRNWELSCSACAHPVSVGHSKAMKGKEQGSAALQVGGDVHSSSFGCTHKVCSFKLVWKRRILP